MRNYRFQFHLIPTLICAPLFCLMLWLSNWQWERGLYKQELMALHQAGSDAEPLTLQQAETLGKDIQGYPVQLLAELRDQKTFILDNQPIGQKPGFQVLTLATSATGQAVLINRGWMPWNAQRELPVIPQVMGGELLLKGLVYFPSDKQFVLQEDDWSQLRWPMLVQKIDLPAMSNALGVELAPLVIRLIDTAVVEQGDQLKRQWPIVNMGPEKHQAYSFQWLGMAVALLVLFVVFSLEKETNHESIK